MRLVTRGDLDGLTATVLITTMEDVDDLELIHPQDITDRKFSIMEGDIMANLPYHPSCSMWFDHHELTDSNTKPPEKFVGRHAIAPSVARVIYDYYNSDKLKRYDHLVAETDRMDSAQLSMEDILNPKDEILLGFTIDPRTGIGKFKEYFWSLSEWIKVRTIRDILREPEVAERVRIYKENNETFLEELKAHSKAYGNVIITDFRPMERPPIGNRFLIYTLYPECNVSVRLQWGPQKKYVAATIGHSIFNRTCTVNIGHLCSDYGGGGHKGAGACILDPNMADVHVDEIVRILNAG